MGTGQPAAPVGAVGSKTMANRAWRRARRGANAGPGDGLGRWGRCLCCLLVGAGGDDVAHGESLVAEMVLGRLVVPSRCSSWLALCQAEPLQFKTISLSLPELISHPSAPGPAMSPSHPTSAHGRVCLHPV